jgi:hypothetical protein
MEPAVMSAAPTTSTRTVRDGADELGYELGRYTVPEGERVLRGRRVNGAAIVIDAPAGSEGRVYLVERDVGCDGYSALRALVADCIAAAQTRHQIPMAKAAAGPGLAR